MFQYLKYMMMTWLTPKWLAEDFPTPEQNHQPQDCIQQEAMTQTEEDANTLEDNKSEKVTYKDALLNGEKKIPYNLKSIKQKEQLKKYKEDSDTVIEELQDFFKNGDYL